MMMRTKIYPILVTLMLFAVNSYAGEGNPDACDCNTIVVSEGEAANGCPAGVKEKVCPLFKEAMMRKQQMQMEQERRKLERSVEPRYGAPR